MKIIATILLVCFCAFAIEAQNEAPIDDLLDHLSQNHMGSISDVFSTEEIQILQEHFSEIYTNQNSPDFLVNRRFSSTKGNTPVSVAVIDPSNLDVQLFGASPLPEFEGAGISRFDPSLNVYIIDNANQIYIRGVNNNTYNNLGTIGNIPAGESIVGAELSSMGDIYLLSTNGSNSSHLFLLDKSGLMANPIGGNNGLVLPINLGRDANDNLFTLDIDNDAIYGIDAASGVVNLIGNAGFDANFGQGMCYDPFVDKIFLAAFNNTIFDSELRELNPITGATVSLGIITPGILDQFGWIDAYDGDLATTDLNLFGFSFYPNPSSDKLSFKATSNIEALTIYNITGQIVLKESVNTSNGQIDVSQLQTGLYILEVQMNGSNSSYKLIKN